MADGDSLDGGKQDGNHLQMSVYAEEQDQEYDVQQIPDDRYL
jgi:hypothetical protein